MNSNALLAARWHALFPEQTTQHEERLAALIASYSEGGRHYHNADHIAALLRWSDSCAVLLQDKTSIDFAILYHDIIYEASRKDNEEASASRAATELKTLGVAESTIQQVVELILATKQHEAGGELKDVHYLLDFDLSTLGASPEVYDAYATAIRKEYSRYPNMFYKPGRKKVLQHFLDMDFIYRTPLIREQLETQARENLLRELQRLG